MLSAKSEHVPLQSPGMGASPPETAVALKWPNMWFFFFWLHHAGP